MPCSVLTAPRAWLPEHVGPAFVVQDAREHEEQVGEAVQVLQDLGVHAPLFLRQRAELLAIQNDLFDVGADLCVPGEAGERLRLTPVYTEKIEQIIDRENAKLAPLKSFILPGGREVAAWMHVARNVCRRAERLVSELGAREEEQGRVNPEVLKYLNRLSDLLFVLARVLNDGGQADVLWQPGQRRS